MSSLAEQIKKLDRPPTPVTVDQWGVTVYLRPLSVKDRLRLSDYEGRTPESQIADVVVWSVTDAQGEPVWADPEDVLGLEWAAVLHIHDAIKKLNKLDQTVEDGEVEKKDSTATPSAGSPTASPSPSAAP